jgi:peptidoglycan/LPS O-acetylase OafA/YrhL
MLELDLLRLVAAILVVLYHYTWGRGRHTVEMEGGITIVTRYGFLGVQLFFLISGFVILASARGRTGRQFAVSRFVRLYPAYWLMATVTLVTVILIGEPGNDRVTPRNWLVNLTMLQAFVPDRFGITNLDSVYWTLAVELVFYVIVFVTIASGQGRAILPILFAWLVASALIELVLGPVDVFRTFFAVQYAPFFVAGALASEVAAGRRSWPIWTGFAIASVLCVRQGVDEVRSLGADVPGLQTWVGAAAVVGFLAIILAVALGYGRTIGRPWMLTAGLLTYPLYLVHQQVGYAIQYRVQSLGDWPALVISVLVVVAIAWVGHRLVERPASALLRRRLTRPSRRLGDGDLAT